MFVYWNNSSSNPYWNSNLERNWNIHEYSSLFMFLEFQESREICKCTHIADFPVQDNSLILILIVSLEEKGSIRSSFSAFWEWGQGPYELGKFVRKLENWEQLRSMKSVIYLSPNIHKFSQVTSGSKHVKKMFSFKDSFKTFHHCFSEFSNWEIFLINWDTFLHWEWGQNEWVRISAPNRP